MKNKQKLEPQQNSDSTADNSQVVEEGNKLIAEFMGEKISQNGMIEFQSNGFGLGTKTLHKMEYHSSFDWLKPAIDEFLSIDISEFNYNAVAMTEFRMVKASLANMSISKSISDFFNELLTAIKWYNKNKQS